MPVPNFPEALKPKIFEVITQASEELNLETYVIGGYVRDFLLKRGSAKDIDIVAVGSGIELAEKVAS
ncbi:MAG TPA: tRNA nucleotidyltransferase, partial [Leeuwenhoekiella sp.]|nr:tRNA nucleotidyltransferase [Leeuwenhoekiella sp.]